MDLNEIAVFAAEQLEKSRGAGVFTLEELDKAESRAKVIAVTLKKLEEGEDKSPRVQRFIHKLNTALNFTMEAINGFKRIEQAKLDAESALVKARERKAKLLAKRHTQTERELKQAEKAEDKKKEDAGA